MKEFLGELSARLIAINPYPHVAEPSDHPSEVSRQTVGPRDTNCIQTALFKGHGVQFSLCDVNGSVG